MGHALYLFIKTNQEKSKLLQEYCIYKILDMINFFFENT